MNCSSYFPILYKDNINLRSKIEQTDKLLVKLSKLLIDYCKKPPHAKKLWKYVFNKIVKPKTMFL